MPRVQPMWHDLQISMRMGSKLQKQVKEEYMDSIKYFVKIVNYLIDENTEYIYRKIMLSIIDIIEDNKILYADEYQEEFNYAVSYWRYNEGAERGLIGCQKKIHEFFC